MTRKSKSLTAPAPGLRQQNKLDKLQRIRTAARELFKKHGYGAATMRQIAHQAHVGLGTLFDYADDKRDLVFLIFNEELDALADRALAAAPPDASLVDQLIAVFSCHYEHFGKDVALSRLALQELTFYSAGKQADTFQAIRGRLIVGIEKLVAEAQRAGRIRPTPAAELIARHIFFVYSAAIRWWIAGAAPGVAEGIADLRRLLQLQIEGLAATAGTDADGAGRFERLPATARRAVG